jgi:DNA-binding MarR family transcriptional regulator
MNPNNNFNYLLTHLSAVISKQSDQLLQEQFGIGLSQYRILMVLDWNPHIQQRAIADSLGQSEASISRQIKLLKRKSLLSSKVDPNNKRKHISTVSPLGMQVTEAANELLKRSLDTDATNLRDKKLNDTLAGLQELHKIICKQGKTGSCDHQLGN